MFDFSVLTSIPVHTLKPLEGSIQRPLWKLESDGVDNHRWEVDSPTGAVQACGGSRSTYPKMPEALKREGDPLCDFFAASALPNRLFFAVADGCSW